jgi:hypothetical protein
MSCETGIQENRILQSDLRNTSIVLLSFLLVRLRGVAISLALLLWCNPLLSLSKHLPRGHNSKASLLKTLHVLYHQCSVEATINTVYFRKN